MTDAEIRLEDYDGLLQICGVPWVEPGEKWCRVAPDNCPLWRSTPNGRVHTSHRIQRTWRYCDDPRKATANLVDADGRHRRCMAQQEGSRGFRRQ